MGLDNSGGRVAIRCSGTLIVVRRHFVWGGVVVLVVEFLARPKKDLFHGSLFRVWDLPRNLLVHDHAMAEMIHLSESWSRVRTF